MKQFAYLLSAMLILTLVSACITTENGSGKKDKPSTETSTDKAPVDNKEPEKEDPNPDGIYDVTTQGIRISSKSLAIQILSVKESRCPANTNCFVAGEAKILLKITKDGKSVEATVIAKGMCEGDQGNCGTSTMVPGAKIQLLNVYPYPTASAKIEQGAYIAKVRID